MRKKIIVCLSVIGLINCLQGQQFSITARINAENGITINSATSTLNSSSTLSSFGINSIRRAYPNTNNSILNKFLSFKSTGNVDTLIKRLNSLGIFSIIKKDEQVRTMVCNTQISSFANDPVISNGGVNNYALNLIEAPCAWNITRGDSRIVLGIADTEFDINHQDLIFKINSTKNSPYPYPRGTISFKISFLSKKIPLEKSLILLVKNNLQNQLNDLLKKTLINNR